MTKKISTDLGSNDIMNISKRTRDDSDEQLHPNNRNPNHKKAKTKARGSWNNRDIKPTTRQPTTHKVLDTTGIGERVKLMRAHRSSATLSRHISQSSSFEQNSNSAKQSDTDEKDYLSTASVEEEDDESIATDTSKTKTHIPSDKADTPTSDVESDTTIDVRTDASGDDLLFTAETLIAIRERYPAPRESPVGAAETLLLFAAREVRTASEEVVDMAGSYGRGTGALTKRERRELVNHWQTSSCQRFSTPHET